MEATQTQASNNITVTGSPHIRGRMSTQAVMWNVVFSLLPTLAWAFYIFGWRALAVVAVTIVASMSTEYVIERYLLRKQANLTDGSAFLTGLLLGMSLPSSIDFGIAFAGGVFAIGIGKMAFGGLGQNIFNPALVGRVFLLISFPVAMTTWPLPFAADGRTGATILSSIAESGLDPSTIDYGSLAIGNMGGSLGEVGSLTLLIGGLYLIARRIIRWYIPTAILATVALMSIAFGADIIVELLSGGMLLGAIFMATDYVTSPMTPKGMIVYGVMIGILTFIIRQYGAYPEGISFAILLMNGLTPLINRWMKPRVFGERGSR